MFDILKRSIVSIVGGAFLIYLGFLFAHGTAIVASEILEYNTVMYIFLFVLVGFFTVVYGVYPISMRMQKATLFAVGIVCIFVGYTYLVDDITSDVYVSDFVRLLGVLIVLFGATGSLITKKVKKQLEDKNIEIIEV